MVGEGDAVASVRAPRWSSVVPAQLPRGRLGADGCGCGNREDLGEAGSLDSRAIVRGAYQVSVDVLIVGGGLAGSAAAITLARAGRSVVLVERESVPQHKVCGEFLSQEAMTYLGSLGIDLIGLGAVAIRSVRLAGREGWSEARLPFAAMSLTRKRLDEELLRVAE